ncbi:MAG: iron-containing redox enzyme family protein [Tolypothrix carrinoi HA7290-LM1]|nr:iron-containing redox enzyme family protein [Tolypothrix carrinoi HA7290-LM1]
MQTNLVRFPIASMSGNTEQTLKTASTKYDCAMQQFQELLATEDLDNKLDAQASIVSEFEDALRSAISDAYQKGYGDDDAHCFLQRILYGINRLKLFWYDDLRHYNNERSLYLSSLCQQIEAAWQNWELAQIDVACLQQLDVKDALIKRAAEDLDPPLSSESRYIREEMSVVGYRHLLAIASFDGLVEGSRLSRILGGAANEVQCTLVRVLLEEYGNGRLSRKHSTFFKAMMAEFGMNTQPEGYFDLVPWQVLACANHNFLVTECKRHFLRYSGGLTYFEVAGPAAYRNYLTAAQRLQLSEAAMGYWELHIREDERHGRWMLDDVALPLAEQYPSDAWELVLGYDQEKLMGDRAAAAVVRSIREAEHSALLIKEIEKVKK